MPRRLLCSFGALVRIIAFVLNTRVVFAQEPPPSVDVANASWTNTLADPELITVWRDPAFDPGQRAFYYARVLEIPTPRWTAYDVKQFGVKPLPGTTMTLQERAYTSPIWYSPPKSLERGNGKS